MTEFFNHLVSRHASPGEMPSGEFLRPRLPSLFEDPVAAGSKLPVFQADLIGSTPRGGPASRVESQGYSDSSAETGWRAQAGDNQVDPGQPLRSRKNNRANERQAAVRRQLTAREPGTPAGRETNLSLIPSSESGEKAERPSTERGSSHISNGPEQGSQEGGLIFRPALESIHPMPSVIPSSPFGDAGQSVLGPVSFSGPREEALETTIHISIGRIEVRAVTQAGQPPVRQAPPPRPKLTLDEYLRQRNKGER